MLQAVTGSGEHLAVLLAAQGVGLHPGRRCHQVDGQVQTGGVEELLPIVVSAEEGLPIQPSDLDLLGGRRSHRSGAAEGEGANQMQSTNVSRDEGWVQAPGVGGRPWPPRR
jgi:hypothetical protein